MDWGLDCAALTVVGKGRTWCVVCGPYQEESTNVLDWKNWFGSNQEAEWIGDGDDDFCFGKLPPGVVLSPSAVLSWV